MLADIKTACEELKNHDDFLIFAHQKPDGDTLGASFALMWALIKTGKKARVFCADGFPERYGFICGDYVPDKSFEPQYVIAADIAGPNLISDKPVPYSDRVDLCIDHHKSNTLYAKMTVLDAKSASACEVMLKVIKELGVEIDSRMATAIFTGITTDTGCFKYSNVTADTHRAAAAMIDAGAKHAKVNKLMFDTQTRGMLMVNLMMIETTKFYADGKIAIAVLHSDIYKKYGVTDDELDGISSFPIRIVGVCVGVTVKEKPDGSCRASVRSVSPVDASRICASFGGGGHTNAAGCTINCTPEEAVSRIVTAAEEELKKSGII